MPYETPTVDDVLNQGLAEWRSRLPEGDVSEGSDPWHMLKTFAQMIGASMFNALTLARSVNPKYSDGSDLTELAARFGLTRKEATGAEGLTLQINCTTSSGTWLASLQARSADGLTYQVTSGGSWTSSGIKSIVFNAVDTGAATSKGDGTNFTILSPPAGMESTGVQLGAATTAGRDEETDEELRERLLNRLQGLGNSGSRSNYVGWAEEATNVAEAFAYWEQRADLAVDCCIFGPKTSPGTRWLAAADATEVEDLINGTAITEGYKPVGADFDAILPTKQNQPVDLTLDSDEGYGRDWGTAWNTELTLVSLAAGYAKVSDDPTAQNLEVGDRIAVNCQVDGAYYHLEVRTVTNIVVNGANWDLYVDEDFTSLVASGNVIPAGPTTEGTVTALEAAFDALGPADTSPASRWPPVSSVKPCDLVHAELNRRIMDVEVEGVRRHLDVTWTTPGADVTATTSAVSGAVLVANCIRLTTCHIRYNTLNE